MNRARRGVAGAALALMLCACATPVQRAPTDLAGRIALRVDAQPGSDARSWAADFDLRGDSERGELRLTGPLGAMLAQARWQPGLAQLDTPEASQSFATLDALSESMLGERLPLAALVEWLRGRPWRGAPSQAIDGGFEQLGWRVDLARFAEGIVHAARDRAPALNVRVRLERAS